MSSRSRHHKSSHSHSHSHHSNRKRNSDSEDDDYSSNSTSDYKRLYKDAAYDLKRKRNDCDELNDKLDKEHRETKKAKQDTQDLWKIYYTLQQELQQSYERNAKLQAEKAAVETDLEEHKKKSGENVIGTNDPDKIREALFSMQKQKLEMQTKFNELVLENKRLKDKEINYEPRLRELDAIKDKLKSSEQQLNQTCQDVLDLTQKLESASYSVDVVDEHKKWNSMLMIEAQQKGTRLRNVENDTIKEKNRKVQMMREGLKLISVEVKQIKMEAESWSGQVIKSILNEIATMISGALKRTSQLAHQFSKFDDSWLADLKVKLSNLAQSYDQDKQVETHARILLRLLSSDEKTIPKTDMALCDSLKVENNNKSNSVQVGEISS